MRAVQLEDAGRLVERDLPTPEPATGQVLVAIEAAGICHSDAHYRSGNPLPPKRPVTLGHEIAGTIARCGPGVDPSRIGARVALHYVLSCGTCTACGAGREQFCRSYEMVGNTVDGGFAEYVVVPDGNAVSIPSGVSTEQAAIMMCSSVTALHALRRGRMRAGETVAIYGAGGLGQTAVRLAAALGAGRVFAIDTDPERLAIAADGGAIPVAAAAATTDSTLVGSVDLAIEMVGSTDVVEQALAVLADGGRAVAVGISQGTVAVGPYTQMIARELELIGSNDHTLAEVVDVLAMAGSGAIDLSAVVTQTVTLSGDAINAALDRLDVFGPGMRTVVVSG